MMKCPVCKYPFGSTQGGSSNERALLPTPPPTPGPSARRNRENSSEIVCPPCGHLIHRDCITAKPRKRLSQGKSHYVVEFLEASCPRCDCIIKMSQLYPVYLDDESAASQTDVGPSLQNSGVVQTTTLGILMDSTRNLDDSPCEREDCVEARILLKLTREDCTRFQDKINHLTRNLEEVADREIANQLQIVYNMEDDD